MSTAPNTPLHRRAFLSLFGAGAGALAIGGLTACAPQAASPGSGLGQSQDTGSAEFGFLSWSLNEAAPKPVLEKIIADYAGSSGATITPAAFPYDDYLNQFTLQVRGGQFHGVAQLNVQWLAAAAALGKLRDLAPQAQQASYTDAAMKAGQVDGVQYGLPWTIASIGLVANRDFLDSAGITEPPATIAEFEQALMAIKEANRDVIPYAGMTKVDQLKDMFVWMRQFGSPLLDGDRVTIGDEASVEAVAWYKSLFDRKLIAPDVGRFDARSLFSQGRTAMYEDAIIAKGAVTKGSPDPDLATKLVPMSRPVVSTGDAPQAVLWGHVVGVVEGKGAEAASDFASYLTSDPQAMTTYFEQLGLPPTTEDLLSSDPVRSDEYTSTWTERITATAEPDPFWPYPAYGQIKRRCQNRCRPSWSAERTLARPCARPARRSKGSSREHPLRGGVRRSAGIAIVRLPEAAMLPAARAGVEGGITVPEIALTTPGAAEEITRLRRELPDLVVASGSVRTPRDVTTAAAALVSPFLRAKALAPAESITAGEHGTAATLRQA